MLPELGVCRSGVTQICMSNSRFLLVVRSWVEHTMIVSTTRSTEATYKMEMKMKPQLSLHRREPFRKDSFRRIQQKLTS